MALPLGTKQTRRTAITPPERRSPAVCAACLSVNIAWEKLDLMLVRFRFFASSVEGSGKIVGTGAQGKAAERRREIDVDAHQMTG